MELLKSAIKVLTENQELAGVAVALGLAVVKIFSQKMNAGQAAMLILNTLKDEHKMDDGKKFTDEAVEKLVQVGDKMEVGEAVVKDVKKQIKKFNESVDDPAKNKVYVGSYKGKPIHISKRSLVGKLIGKIF